MPTAVLDTTKLADRLVTKVDSIRGNVHGKLGTRPHTVEVVRRTWTGPRRGEGTASDVRTAISPPPAVHVRVGNRLRPAGLEEEGDVVLTEISLTWAENELHEPALADTEEHYFRIIGAHGQGVRPRYYVPMKPPVVRRGDHQGDQIDWRLELRRVERSDLP
ncbi:MAG: hypothetical protein MJE77_37820 [Proteobacteria bacterium]|nr:hypothetical protein [Pseudomonadota bacterium]